MKQLKVDIIYLPVWMISFVLMFLLAGCRAPNYYAENTNAILPYKVAGAKDADNIELEKDLRKKGIEVLTIGQDYEVSVSSTALFAEQSPRLLWGSYGLLNEIACYLRQFRKVSVHVSAYTSKCSSRERELALTKARTHAVANYLWSQDIGARIIFTHPLGSDKPIMAYDHGGDKSPNSRIEITFREAIV